jgi:hypothetical protein
MMQAHGQATVWETYLGIGRARDVKGWYQQLRSGWAARAAARRQAQPVALDASWDAQHEAVRPLRADAAQEMAAAQGVLTVATVLYGLSQ